MIYLLDSDILISANKKYYPPDVFPCVWDWIVNKYNNNEIKSIEEVRDEILMGNDNLVNWVNCNKDLFLDKTALTVVKYNEVANHVRSLGKRPSQENDFLDCADPWLIATALEMGSTSTIIVTNESRVDESSHTIKIPNICNFFEIKTCDFSTAMIDLNAVFHSVEAKT